MRLYCKSNFTVLTKPVDTMLISKLDKLVAHEIGRGNLVGETEQ